MEGHYHDLAGGMKVSPRLSVRVAAGARYFSDFSPTEGRVGTLEIDQHIEAGENAIDVIVTGILR